MTHTAELLTYITPEEYSRLITQNIISIERGKETHIRELAQYGITDLHLKRVRIEDKFTLYQCKAVINLQRIVNDGQRTIATYDNENDFPTLARNFEKYMSPILPQYSNISTWSLQRIDYNIDLKMSAMEVEQYITLLQRGNKNYSWKIHETAQEKKARQRSGHGRRKKTHPPGSVLFDNKQYSVNIYNKQWERIAVQEKRGIVDIEERKAAEGILRIEIQVKQNKVNALKDRYGIPEKSIERFARYDIAVPIITKALMDITGTEDYCTLEIAEKRIMQGVTLPKTRIATIEFLRLVSRTRSLWRAKELYRGEIKEETVMQHLKRLDINPVTIPVSFHRDIMESLYTMAAVQLAEEQSRYCSVG